MWKEFNDHTVDEISSASDLQWSNQKSSNNTPAVDYTFLSAWFSLLNKFEIYNFLKQQQPLYHVMFIASWVNFLALLGYTHYEEGHLKKQHSMIYLLVHETWWLTYKYNFVYSSYRRHWCVGKLATYNGEVQYWPQVRQASGDAITKEIRRETRKQRNQAIYVMNTFSPIFMCSSQCGRGSIIESIVTWIWQTISLWFQYQQWWVAINLSNWQSAVHFLWRRMRDLGNLSIATIMILLFTVSIISNYVLKKSTLLFFSRALLICKAHLLVEVEYLFKVP